MGVDLNKDNSEVLDANVLAKNKLMYLFSLTMGVSFVAFFLMRSTSPLASIAFFLVSIVCTAVIAIGEVKRMLR